ncbi:hypothetical protein V3C99_018083 [Haemonchus contortus]|nr:endonuclease-reverse transcriptase [Haemonchus contortus]
MTVRIDTKDGYWTIKPLYAPQVGCPVVEKDEFYMSLDEAIRSVPEGDYLTIAGDLNGHVGSERRSYEKIHGGNGIGFRNEEEERILDLATANELAVCSTFFAKTKAQKITDRSGGKEIGIEDLASHYRPPLADIAIDPLKKLRIGMERRIRRWKLNRVEREHFEENTLEARLKGPEGPIQQT